MVKKKHLGPVYFGAFFKKTFSLMQGKDVVFPVPASNQGPPEALTLIFSCFSAAGSASADLSPFPAADLLAGVSVSLPCLCGCGRHQISFGFHFRFSSGCSVYTLRPL